MNLKLAVYQTIFLSHIKKKTYQIRSKLTCESYGDNFEKKTNLKDKSRINLMLKNKNSKKKPIFLNNEFDSTNQTLDTSHTHHWIQ